MSNAMMETWRMVRQELDLMVETFEDAAPLLSNNYYFRCALHTTAQACGRFLLPVFDGQMKHTHSGYMLQNRYFGGLTENKVRERQLQHHIIFQITDRQCVNRLHNMIR